MNRSGRTAGEPSSERPALSETPRPGDCGAPAWLVGPLLAGVGLGFVAYRCVVERLVDDRHVVARETLDGHTVRAEVLRWGGVALLALAVVVAISTWRRYAGVRGSLGAALFGLGVAWFVWSSIDMHVLDVYTWREAGEYSLVDFAYHGGGLVVAAAGYAMVIRGLRMRDD